MMMLNTQVVDQLYVSFLWYASSLYQSGQGHSCDRADQFDCLAIVDVAISHSELLSFRLLVIH